MTKKSLIPGLRAKIHRLRFTSPDEAFQLALDVMSHQRGEGQRKRRSLFGNPRPEVPRFCDCRFRADKKLAHRRISHSI